MTEIKTTEQEGKVVTTSFAKARAIFWANPKQDRATFLASCAAVGMNPATAKTRFYCLTTDRDASCKDESLRSI